MNYWLVKSEPEAYAWVHATLAVSIVASHNRFGRPFTAEQTQRFWSEWRGLGRLLGIRERDLPASWGGFLAYVDEIIDTGLTLSWLVNNLSSRSPASVEIATLLRKPEALSMPVEPKYVGWDIPNEFVVGYGLDYRERYRNLRDIGTLAPHVYS